MRSCSATAARPRSGTPPPAASSRERALHLVYGEFSSKFATVTRGAPFLADPIVITADPGDAPDPVADRRRRRLDVLAWAHNETSTGVMVPVVAARRDARRRALVLIDATSGAGGLPVDVSRRRRLLLRAAEGLRAPTAGCGSRCSSPAALERIVGDRRRAARRAVDPRVPVAAAPRSRTRVKDQTYNTPALATLFLLADQLDWMLAQGGLDAMVAPDAPSPRGHLYGWAEAHAHATPFVADPAKRSLVVGTIDFDDAVDAAALAATLRANGIVDVEPYRKLGRNQLRIAMFPATRPGRRRRRSPRCIDYVLEQSRMRGPRRREDRRLRRRAAARALRRRARRRLEPRRAGRAASPGFDGILIRSATKLDAELLARPTGCAPSAAPASASTTSTSPRRPSAGSSSPTRRSRT